jgi:hypothetical protein
MGALLRTAWHNLMRELAGWEEVARLERIVEVVMKKEDLAGLTMERCSHERGSRANVTVILLLPQMVCVRRPVLRGEEETATAYNQELYCRERAELLHLQLSA